MKKLILSVFSICILLGSMTLCFADEIVNPKLELFIPSTSKTQDTHAVNTPQWGDELQAIVTYDKTVIKSVPIITWYRFNNHPKYDEFNNKIADSYYEQIHVGPSYIVTSDDIGHTLKVEAKISGETLSHETNVVAKRNYGDIKLKVVDNTTYGDTDGYIGYLDTRMQYTSDDVTIFDVDSDGTVLLSGPTSENLNPNGYSWKVRYRDTKLVQGSDWYVFTIKPGQKIPLENADINLVSRTLTPSEPEYQLKTTLSPENAYIGNITYVSSNEKVATVSDDGLIQAVNNGTATITVNIIGTDNKFTKECEITVKNFDILSEAVIEEDNVSLELQNNESILLTSSVLPKTVGEYVTSWRSSDESICTVDSHGLVRAVSEGNAVLTFSAVQGDVSVIDTVNVEVLPVPCVSSSKEWIVGCRKDLVFEFVGYTPDENTIVSIKCENGRSEKVYHGNYRIEDNKIIIDYEYLQYLPLGNTLFSFNFPDEVSSPAEEADKDSSHESIIAPASYTGTYGSLLSRTASVISSKIIKLVSDNNTNTNDVKPTSGSNSSEVSVSVLFTVSPSVCLEPGETVFKYGPLSPDTYSFEKDTDFDKYFVIEDHLSDDAPYFLIKSKGNNTPDATSYTLTLKKESYIVQTWNVSATNFIDFTNVSFTLDSTAKISSDSKSTCIITPTLSNDIVIDDDFLNGYDITFMEVGSIDKEHKYSGGPFYFKQDSLVLDTSDYKLHAVANREGTGYIRGILSLKMTDGTTTYDPIEIKKSSNSTSVSIDLYEDVTSSNRQHLWSQNSYVNLTYTIQGDFSRFLRDYGGTFSDANVRLWYKKGTTYNPLTISNGQFYVEVVNESMVNVVISYNVLRRLYLGSYPLYISFKYDGSDFSLGPWNGSTWSKNGNYVLTMFTIIRAGIPIIGDAFKPAIWIGIAMITISFSAVFVYVLRKKKKRS